MGRKQILLILVLGASMAGIALSDTDNTQVENMTPTATAICDPVHDLCGNITPLPTETPVSTVTDTPNETVTDTPIPSPNVTITPTPTPIPSPGVTETPVPTTVPIPTNTSTNTSIPNQKATVIFTFDDGWLTVYTKAYPILKANNQSGVAFVNVEPVLGGWSDFMSKADLDALYGSGWDISSHTYSHVDLSLLNDSALRHELNDTKNWLDTNGYPRGSMLLSYPYGGYNNNVITALKTYGYAAARTVDLTTTYTNYNLSSPDIYLMKNYEAIGGIDNDVTIINQIQNAIAVHGLLILSFHKVVDNLSVNATDAETEFKASDFQNVSNYLKSNDVDVRTLSDYLGTIPKVIPVVNNTPVVNTTIIPNITNTPIVTSTPDLAKYTSESGGRSSGGNYMDSGSPPIPIPVVTESPIPTKTVDFNNHVVTESSKGVRYIPSNAEVPQVNKKGLFERIKVFLINLWRMIR